MDAPVLPHTRRSAAYRNACLAIGTLCLLAALASTVGRLRHGGAPPQPRARRRRRRFRPPEREPPCRARRGAIPARSGAHVGGAARGERGGRPRAAPFDTRHRPDERASGDGVMPSPIPLIWKENAMTIEFAGRLRGGHTAAARRIPQATRRATAIPARSARRVAGDRSGQLQRGHRGARRGRESRAPRRPRRAAPHGLGHVRPVHRVRQRHPARTARGAAAGRAVPAVQSARRPAHGPMTDGRDGH